MTPRPSDVDSHDTSLGAQQALFWKIVTGRGSLPAQTRQRFSHSTRLACERGLRLYRSMYRTRIGQLLRATYPNLERSLGIAEFRKLAMTYLEQYPSQDPRLEFVGDRMSLFLTHHPHEPWQRLAPAAALDWARWAAPLAPDPESILRPEDINPARFATSHLVMIPSLQLVIRAEQPALALWSERGVVHERELGSAEALSLGRALSGHGIPEICECFAEQENPVTEATRILAGWLERHWVAALEDSKGGDL